MQVTVEKLSPVLVEFQVRIPADLVKQSMDKAFNDLARRAQVKGFRKGKAPRHILVHLYGDRVANDVANHLVDDSLPRAIKQQKTNPVSNPTIEKGKVSPAEDFAYKARFEITPQIDKVDFEGIEAKRPVFAVTEEMISAELERLRQAHANLVAPTPARPAKKGDSVTFDFGLDIEGKAVDGAATSNMTAEIGAGNMLPALSEAMEGKEAGAAFDVTTTFPANHPQESVRGKAGVFHVTLKEIKEKVLPQLDDEFAKDLGQVDTLDALKQSIRERIERQMKERSENQVAEALIAELCKKNPIPVPPSLVEQQARLQENEVLQQARRQGNDVSSLSPELRRAISADAEHKVRAGLLMAEIAKAKGVQVTDEDIQNAYKELAEQTGKNVAKVKAQYQDPKQREMLIGLIVEDKVLTIIETAAKIEEVAAKQEG